MIPLGIPMVGTPATPYVNPATFPTITGLIQRYKANVGVTSSGGLVTVWADQSGLGNNQNVVTSGIYRPNLITTDPAFNNQSTIEFVGPYDSGPFMIGNGTFTSEYHGSLTFFAVAGCISSAQSNTIFAGLDSAQTVFSAICDVKPTTGYPWISSDSFVNDLVGTVPIAAATALPHVICFEYSVGGTSKIYVDSAVENVTGNLQSANPGYGLLAIGTGDVRMVGKVAELNCYNAILSTPDRITMMRHLAYTYGVTLT